MNLPDTHEKVIRCLMTCRTPEQLAGAKRYASLWKHRLIDLWTYAADPVSRNTFIAYHEMLEVETNRILNP